MDFIRNTFSRWEIIFIAIWGSNTKCIVNLWIHTVTRIHMHTCTNDRCNNLTWRPRINLRSNATSNLTIHSSDQGDFQKLPMHFVRHVCEHWSGQNGIIICYETSKSTNKMLQCFPPPGLFYSNSKATIPWIKSYLMQKPLLPVLLINDNQADLSFNTS